MFRKISLAKRVLCISLLAVQAYLTKPLIQAQEQKPFTLGDAKELEAFLDPIFATQMEKQHIPGAAIAVVRDALHHQDRGGRPDFC